MDLRDHRFTIGKALGDVRRQRRWRYIRILIRLSQRGGVLFLCCFWLRRLIRAPSKTKGQARSPALMRLPWPGTYALHYAAESKLGHSNTKVRAPTRIRPRPAGQARRHSTARNATATAAHSARISPSETNSLETQAAAPAPLLPPRAQRASTPMRPTADEHTGGGRTYLGLTLNEIGANAYWAKSS